MNKKRLFLAPDVAVCGNRVSVSARQVPSKQALSNKFAYALCCPILVFFFVGCTVKTSLGSILSPRLFSIGCFTFLLLFGFTFTKPNHWKITHKGLLLIAVPLVTMLIFVALVLSLKNRNKEFQYQTLHSEQVIAQTQLLLRILIDAETGMRGYVITADKRFLEPYASSTQRLSKELNTLREFVQDNPLQQERVNEIAQAASEKMAFIKNTEVTVDAGNRDAAIALVKTGEGRRIMEGVRQQIAVFLQEEERLQALRRQALDASWQQFNMLLLIGVLGNTCLTLFLAFFFNRGIKDRVQAITKNIQSVAEGKNMAAVMEGNDELAHLDKAFHKIADELDIALQKERVLTENATDVICSLDANGVFVNMNPASFKAWGYKPEELIGVHYSNFVVQEDRTRSGEAEAALLHGEILSDFENRYRHRNGTEVWMTWSATWSETAQLMICVGRDISARKQVEAFAEQQKRALEKSALELAVINQELESFSYSVSHDLRAPLRHIDGFVNLLQNNMAAKLDEKNARYLTTISQAAKQMGQLIDELLSFSRMGRAEMRTAIVNLEEIVRAALLGLQSDTHNRRIVWKFGNLPQVQGDASMLKLVMTNLLSNAIKYTRQRPEAVIEVNSLNGNPDKIIVFVRDNGAGFDMKYAGKLFGVFQRLHSMSEFEGTGIGLANVRRIIHRHGGETWAEGKVDEGATFYFSLPIVEKGQPS
jgi:PAS domain S-box-containing protein